MPDWPHAPVHRLSESGAYMVTAGTYRKAHHLWNTQRLDLLQNALLTTADEFGWRLQAWAVMSNHYHFLAIAPEDPESLRVFLRKLHPKVGKRLNELDRMHVVGECGISSSRPASPMSVRIMQD